MASNPTQTQPGRGKGTKVSTPEVRAASKSHSLLTDDQRAQVRSSEGQSQALQRPEAPNQSSVRPLT